MTSTTASSTSTTSPYDGTCLELKENHCNSCGATEKENHLVSLVRCSRCCIVRYCNANCQRKDYVAHKDNCRAVQVAKDKLEELAIPLRNFIDDEDDDMNDGQEATTNLFETRVGDFWAIEETKDYIRQMTNVISAHEVLAVEVETLEAWSAAVDLYQETLRLNADDNMVLRFCFPIALLRVNRDDDAYAFCRDWISRPDRDPEDDQMRRASSKEGDWIYPREPDCRYLDIFQECMDVEERAQLNLLLSLAIIKMRLVAVHETRLKAFEARVAAASAQDLGPNELEAVRRQVMGPVDVERKLSDQSRQLDQILDLIDRRNEIMVPVLLDPGPMLSQRRPTEVQAGRPSEARMLIEFSAIVWMSIPGASDYLARRLGTRTPRYLPEPPSPPTLFTFTFGGG